MVFYVWRARDSDVVSRSEFGDDVQSASAALDAVRLRDLRARELAPEACNCDSPTQHF